MYSNSNICIVNQLPMESYFEAMNIEKAGYNMAIQEGSIKAELMTLRSRYS